MNKLENFFDHLFTRKRWLIHVVFWFFVLAFYSLFFGRKDSNYVQTSFFIGLLMPVTIVTTYFVNYFLVPKFLMKEKYGLFCLYFVYTLVISVFLEMIVLIATFIFIGEFRIASMSPASVDAFFLLTSLLLVVFVALAIKLLIHWRASREDYQKLMRDKVETELKFLKAQLNPHFLFNTLNNLYYLTSEKSERAPKAVLQLSEMLDYVMHGTKDLFVPLETEWKQVQNYIALESLRYEERLRIDAEIRTDREGYMIAPMVLITLTENAFKHGVMKIAGSSWIKLCVTCKENTIKVAVSNSRGHHSAKGGIGLNNLTNQLQLLYPSRYDLKVQSQNPEEFKVELMLR